MKIYISDKTISKLQSMIDNNKADSISIRKYNPEKDPITNVINKIKLSDDKKVIHKTGKTYGYYVSKEKLKDIKDVLNRHPDIKEHKGSFLPFLPLIFGALAAAGSIAGAGAAIGKAVNDKRAVDEAAKESKRHNLEVEQIARGSGVAAGKGEGLKDFINNLNLEDNVKGTIRNIFKGLKNVFNVERKGGAIYLTPR